MEMEPSLTLNPIGYVRTGKQAKFLAPSQPDAEAAEVNEIELLPGKQFDLALKDLEGFERIWLVWWFHRNEHWRPTVMPPRGPAQRRGVFSTRSPHRPNPIGLTCVTLLGIDGLTFTVGPLDLVDGTPILDIKPYLRTVDAHPESGLGWLEAVEAAEQAPAPFFISLTPEVQMQLDWLRTEWKVDFTERAFGILSRDPSPHRTRRILKMGDRYRIACGPWRMFYRIVGQTVIIEELATGFTLEVLTAPGYERIHDHGALLAFLAR